MNRKITRTKDGRYCTVEIELKDGRLSICGEEGRVVTRLSARQDAIDYWRSYFDDDPNAIAEMNKRMGTKFRSSTAAAKYVLRTDGEFHGLDATKMDDGSVRILESCGQIVEEVREWFPEVAPLLPWHLNDMKAACEHQEALGWGKGKTIALTKDTLTPVQSDVIEADMDKAYADKIEKLFKQKWEEVLHSDLAAHRALKGTFGNDRVTISEVEDLRRPPWSIKNNTTKRVEEYLRGQLRRENPPQVFDHEVFVDSLRAPCPECGYRYGTAWLKRDLPMEIINLAHNVLKGTNDEPSEE